MQRQKIRDLLSTGIDVKGGKYLQSVEELADGSGVRACFKDGSSETGTMIIGTDGANSIVRKTLLGSQGDLTSLPVDLIALVRHFTVEQGQPIRAFDPLLFQCLDPNTGNFLFFGTQVSNSKPNSLILLKDNIGGFRRSPWKIRIRCTDIDEPYCG